MRKGQPRSFSCLRARPLMVFGLVWRRRRHLLILHPARMETTGAQRFFFRSGSPQSAPFVNIVFMRPRWKQMASQFTLSVIFFLFIFFFSSFFFIGYISCLTRRHHHFRMALDYTAPIFVFLSISIPISILRQIFSIRFSVDVPCQSGVQNNSYRHSDDEKTHSGLMLSNTA